MFQHIFSFCSQKFVHREDEGREFPTLLEAGLEVLYLIITFCNLEYLLWIYLDIAVNVSINAVHAVDTVGTILT